MVLLLYCYWEINGGLPRLRNTWNWYHESMKHRLFCHTKGQGIYSFASCTHSVMKASFPFLQSFGKVCINWSATLSLFENGKLQLFHYPRFIGKWTGYAVPTCSINIRLVFHRMYSSPIWLFFRSIVTQQLGWCNLKVALLCITTLAGNLYIEFMGIVSLVEFIV